MNSTLLLLFLTHLTVSLSFLIPTLHSADYYQSQKLIIDDLSATSAISQQPAKTNSLEQVVTDIIAQDGLIEPTDVMWNEKLVAEVKQRCPVNRLQRPSRCQMTMKWTEDRGFTEVVYVGTSTAKTVEGIVKEVFRECINKESESSEVQPLLPQMASYEVGCALQRHCKDGYSKHKTNILTCKFVSATS